MSIDLITIRDLLRDPQYKKYFTTVPKLPPHYTTANMPWKLYVLKSGEKIWRSKRFGTYGEAFAGFKQMLPVIENAAINCVPLTFTPPMRTVKVKGKTEIIRGRERPVIRTIMWTPKIEADMAHHDWCGHCRRPSIFRNMVMSGARAKGYALPTSEPALRCIICGASERITNIRHPEKNQAWDLNRARVS